MTKSQKVQATEQEVTVTVPTLIRALVLCNESRNRLTGFKSTPDFWILEAHAESRGNDVYGEGV